MILEYILGLLFVLSLLILWFFSPLKTSLGKILFKKVLMPHEFDDYISLKSQNLGILISCWVCCSFWLSLLIGIIFMFVSNLPWYYPLVTYLSYPGICYLYYAFVKR